MQVFIEHQGGATGADLERELFIVRKLIERERAALGAAADDFYICSLSNRTIVYKARREAHLLQALKTVQHVWHRCTETLGSCESPRSRPYLITSLAKAAYDLDDASTG